MNKADLREGDVIRRLSSGDLFIIIKFALDKSSCRVNDYNDLEEKNIKGLAAITLGEEFDWFFEVVSPEEIERLKAGKL